MISVENEDGSVSHYMIDYYNGGINLQNLDEGRVLVPDENYWIPIMGQVENTLLAFKHIRENERLHNLASQYWIAKELYESVFEVLREEGQNGSLADQFCIPLGHFGFAKLVPEGKDIDKVAKELAGLRDIMTALQGRSVHLTSLKLGFGEITGYEAGQPLYENQGTYQLKNQRIIDRLSSILIRIGKTDYEFRNLLHSSTLLEYQAWTPFKLEKLRKDKMVKIIFDSVVHFIPDRSTKYCAGLTGMLISIVDPAFMKTKDLFAKDDELLGSYPNYQEYAQDFMNTKISRL